MRKRKVCYNLKFDFIFKYVRTQNERDQLVDLIEEMIQNNFKRDADALPNSSFAKTTSDVIYKEMESLGILNDQEEIEKFLTSMLNELREIPEIRISIALEPTEKLIKIIQDWSETNGLPRTLFNIEVKPEIVGGAIIMSQDGEYANYSLLNQIDKVFAEKKTDILKLYE
jgi:F0F1-type ATP synthase delta subunit